MNSRRSHLLQVALRTFALASLPVSAHAQSSISVNFGSSEPNGSINTASSLTAGAIPVAGTFWNNMPGATQTTPQPLINSSGTASGASVTWSSANTWRSGSGGATATSLNGNLTRGYLDDGAGGNSITISNVPFLAYNVYILLASDQAGGTENTNNNYRPVTVNGTSYAGNNAVGTLSTATITGTANWTGKNWTNDDSLIQGQHYLLAPNRSGLNLIVRGGAGSGASGRGSIAGLQVVDAYTGTQLYWDVNGSTAGSGGPSPSGTWDNTTTNWNTAAGNTAPTIWTGTNQAAVFSAGSDATGSYTVNVDGNQTTDAIILRQGNLSLNGGSISLVNAAVVRSFTAGSTLSIDSNLSSATAIRFDGSGSISLTGDTSATGIVDISSSLNLGDTGTITATGGINVNNGTSAIIDGNLSSGALTLNGSSILGAGDITASSVTLANIGTTNNLTLADSGTLNTTGSLMINRGSVTANGSSTFNVAELRNQTGGITAELHVNDSASVTVANRMVLGDASNAVMAITQTGGTLNSNGSVNNPSGNDMANRWGHWTGGNTNYNLSGGSLNIPSSPLYLSWDGSASLTVSGTGIANIVGIEMGYGTRTQTSTIHLNTGGTLNIGSLGITSGGTTNKTINLNGGTLGALASWSTNRPLTMVSSSTVDTTNGNISLLGAITGTGNLHIQGGKTVVLGGANTFSGTTNVTNSSTLKIAGSHTSSIVLEAGSSLGAGTIGTPGLGVVNNVTADHESKSTFRISPTTSDMIDVLDFNVGGLHTVEISPTGVIAADAVFTVIDYATLTGAGYGGVDVVSTSPRLNIIKEPDDSSAIRVRVISFDSLVWQGNDGTNPSLWDLNTTENWLTSQTNLPTHFLANDIVIFDDSAATSQVNLSGTIQPNNTQFNNNTLNYTLSGAGISGAGTLTKSGTATLELANDNTYSGNTTVEAGLLRIGNGTSGSIGAGNILVNGGNLEVNMAANANYTRPTTLAANTQLEITGNGALTHSATLAGNGNLVINRNGTVTHLGVATALLGNVTVQQGTLVIDGAQNANRFRNNQPITIQPGAAFEFRGVNPTPTAANSIDLTANHSTIRYTSGTSSLVEQSHFHSRNIILNQANIELGFAGTGTAYDGESFQLNGTLSVVGSSPSTITTLAGGNSLNTGIALAGSRTFDVADVTGSPAADLIVDAEIESNDGGGGVLTKQGAGTMRIDRPASYTGGNEILAGTLSVASMADGPGSHIGTGYLAIKGGATVDYTGSATETTTRLLWLDNGASHIRISDPAGHLIMNPTDGLRNQAFSKEGPGSLTIGGVFSGAASITVSDGTLELTAVNTYSGTTTVNGGTLKVTGTSIPDTNALNLNGGVLHLNGNETVDTLFFGNAQQASGTWGATGSGATHIDDARFSGTGVLTVVTGPSNNYETWETSFGITNAGADTDSDDDGILNGIEFVIGGIPFGANSNSNHLLPTAFRNGNDLVFIFRRTDESAGYNPGAEYSTDLTNWTSAVNGVNGIQITETDEFYGAGIDRVEVRIPVTLSQDGKLFSRLKVEVPTP